MPPRSNPPPPVSRHAAPAVPLGARRESGRSPRGNAARSLPAPPCRATAPGCRIRAWCLRPESVRSLFELVSFVHAIDFAVGVHAVEAQIHHRRIIHGDVRRETDRALLARPKHAVALAIHRGLAGPEPHHAAGGARFLLEFRLEPGQLGLPAVAQTDLARTQIAESG